MFFVRVTLLGNACSASFTASSVTLPASSIGARAVNAFGHRPTPAPDLFQHWRLLIDLNGQALAGQGDGSRQPPDPAADDRDLRSHASTVPP